MSALLDTTDPSFLSYTWEVALIFDKNFDSSKLDTNQHTRATQLKYLRRYFNSANVNEFPEEVFRDPLFAEEFLLTSLTMFRGKLRQIRGMFDEELFKDADWYESAVADSYDSSNGEQLKDRTVIPNTILFQLQGSSTKSHLVDNAVLAIQLDEQNSDIIKEEISEGRLTHWALYLPIEEFNEIANNDYTGFYSDMLCMSLLDCGKFIDERRAIKGASSQSQLDARELASRLVLGS